MEKGAGSGLDKVELEDEEIVESVQRVKSKAYDRGESIHQRGIGVHYFHKLIQSIIDSSGV